MSKEETLCEDLNIIKIEPMNVGSYCFDEYEDENTFKELRRIVSFDHTFCCEMILYIDRPDITIQYIQEAITNKYDQNNLVEIVKAAANQNYKYVCIYSD